VTKGQVLVLGPFLSQMPADRGMLPCSFEDTAPSTQ